MAPENDTIEVRVERLLDQLEQPGLTDGEISRLERKLTILQGIESQQ